MLLFAIEIAVRWLFDAYSDFYAYQFTDIYSFADCGGFACS